MISLQPTRNLDCTIANLVERILDKGAIIAADVIVSLGGVPLIGINLRAAIAGMETMIRYGMMEAWDETVRRHYGHEFAQSQGLALLEGEKLSLRVFGSYRYGGPSCAWRPAHIHLTDRRLVLAAKCPARVIREIPLGEVRGLRVAKDDTFIGTPLERLCIDLRSGTTLLLNAADISCLAQSLRSQVEASGECLEHDTIVCAAPNALL